jgi:hypothetical protein
MHDGAFFQHPSLAGRTDVSAVDRGQHGATGIEGRLVAAAIKVERLKKTN